MFTDERARFCDRKAVSLNGTQRSETRLRYQSERYTFRGRSFGLQC